MADDKESTVEDIVKAVYERVSEDQESFDRFLTKAVDMDCLDEFVESYLNLRESGLDFKDAFLTAADEREIEIDDEDEKK